MRRIYTSRWANKELAHLDCQPVGISRGTPRFPVAYRYRRVRELAPGDRAWVEQDVDRFKEAYIDQLREIGAGVILARLERVSGGLPVVLLCFEDVHAGEECHRRYLADFVQERTGTTIPELEAGMIPEREDAAELRLF